jgi:DNA-binding NtrC family response regulator
MDDEPPAHRVLIATGDGSIASGNAPAAKEESSVIELEAAVQKAERRALEKALKSANGNRNVAARLLGISVRSLYYKLEQHGIS